MPFYHNRQARRKYYLSLVAKRYIPAKRADKPRSIFSILASASENISSVMSSIHAQHKFAEIFHPSKYRDFIVYNYVNKDTTGIRQIECAFPKSGFYANEWSTISKAASNRRACTNGAVISSPVIELSLGALH
jgi:hypothetical protein